MYGCKRRAVSQGPSDRLRALRAAVKHYSNPPMLFNFRYVALLARVDSAARLNLGRLKQLTV